MTAAQTRIAETLEIFYGSADRTSAGAMPGHAYKRSVDDLDGGFGRELDLPYRTAISEPLGKMCAYFPTVNEHIAKRNKKLPQLLDLRVPYFYPSFEAMIRMQSKFAEEGFCVRDDYAAGQLDAQVEGVLQEMRELSICGA
ncbi:hypothetical protein C8R42DRAFT_699836 [Lentinula raphanica]|nr:hypothetical protein C8R42DRAFT_699836 [Lentinula raphanica]